MILDKGIQEIRVENQKTGEIIARINENEVETNGDEIVIVVKPVYN